MYQIAERKYSNDAADSRSPQMKVKPPLNGDCLHANPMTPSCCHNANVHYARE